MLTSDDTPTIRNAVLKRLGPEPGVHVAEIHFQKYKRGDIYYDVSTINHQMLEEEPSRLVLVADCPFVRVCLLLQLGESLIVDSRFDLPDPFEHGHLLAEIDEVAQGCKKARRDFFTAALPVSERKFLPGSGTRGNWKRYGLREKPAEGHAD